MIRESGKTALFVGFILVFMVIFSVTTSVYANEGLNGIGTEQQEEVIQQETTDNQSTEGIESAKENVVNSAQNGSSVVGGLFEGIGVDNEASQKASIFMQPVAKFINLAFAVILLVATLGMFLITSLDLLYIAIPPVRNFLNPEGQQQGAGSGMMGGGMMGGGYGMGGYGGRYGMGGGMMGGGSQPQTSFLTRFISDEAVAAVGSQQQTAQQGMGGGMMGGGFGGGFGGMMGGSQPQQPTSTKSVIFDYLKKRVFFLVAFGVCAVLLSTTLFTDLGVLAGGWVLEKLTSLFL